MTDGFPAPLQHHPSFHLRFILSQPASPSLAAAWLPRLQVGKLRDQAAQQCPGPQKQTR